jgi:microcystin-dependent protein
MALETATFISGLTTTWPTASDFKSQGDDHIRLIKGVLQATFPNGSRAFYFPTAEVTTGTLALDATDNQNTVLVDTTAGNVTVTLPAGLATTDKGFWVDVVKTTNDVNAAIVSPSSGTILSKSGSTATVRVGVLSEPSRFFWSGTGWLCFKYGPMIGTVTSFDGPAVPPGYLAMDGSAYSNTAFAELFAVLATATLRDRRGRSDIGEGTGSGLTNRVAGTNYGAETVALTAANHAAHDHPVFLKDNGHFHGYNMYGGTVTGYQSGGSFSVPFGTVAASTDTKTSNITIGSVNGVANDNKTASQGSATPFSILQPVLGAKKIIRAC